MVSLSIFSQGFLSFITDFGMASLEDDTEDLSTCCVCLEPYDKDERKPKFLSCGNTLCLKCVEVS